MDREHHLPLYLRSAKNKDFGERARKAGHEWIPTATDASAQCDSSLLARSERRRSADGRARRAAADRMRRLPTLQNCNVRPLIERGSPPVMKGTHQGEQNSPYDRDTVRFQGVSTIKSLARTSRAAGLLAIQSPALGNEAASSRHEAQMSSARVPSRPEKALVGSQVSRRGVPISRASLRRDRLASEPVPILHQPVVALGVPSRIPQQEQPGPASSTRTLSDYFGTQRQSLSSRGERSVSMVREQWNIVPKPTSPPPGSRLQRVSRPTIDRSSRTSSTVPPHLDRSLREANRLQSHHGRHVSAPANIPQTVPYRPNRTTAEATDKDDELPLAELKRRLLSDKQRNQTQTSNKSPFTRASPWPSSSSGSSRPSSGKASAAADHQSSRSIYEGIPARGRANSSRASTVLDSGYSSIEASPTVGIDPSVPGNCAACEGDVEARREELARSSDSVRREFRIVADVVDIFGQVVHADDKGKLRSQVVSGSGMPPVKSFHETIREDCWIHGTPVEAQERKKEGVGMDDLRVPGSWPLLDS